VRLVHLLAWDSIHRRHLETWLTRTAGSAKHGTWTGALRIPKFVQAGRWFLEIRVTDNVRWVRTMGLRRLAAAGFPSQLTVVSRTDTQRAQVRHASFARLVDVRSAPGSVVVRVRATDERSGVGRLNVSMWPPTDAYPAGDSPSGDARLVSGSRRDGIWQVTLHVEDCSSWTGDWALRIWMWDRVGHRTISDPGTVHVDANDHYFDDGTTPAEPVPVSGPVTVTFDEDVTGISSSTVTVLPEGYARFGASEPPPAVGGSWSCLNAGHAAAACGTGEVRVATFTPSAPLEPGSGYEMWPNLEHIWTVTDLAGNPARSTWRFSTTT
jgi:hypothetical protein